MFCQNCGNKLKKGILICPKCGYDNKITKVQSKGKKIVLIIIGILFFIILSVYLSVYSGYFKLPKNIESKLQEFRILPQYMGNDLVNGSNRSRDEGAKNLEAQIIDSRDGKKYRIVKMPDDRWWFAQNLNYQKDLVENERADFANGIPVKESENGVQGIGSYWCNDFNYFFWSIEDLELLENEKNSNPKSIRYQIRFGGADIIGSLDPYDPPTRERVITRFPGENGSGDAIKRSNVCNSYGALYTWETAMSENGKSEWKGEAYSTLLNSNNICPKGWRLPSDQEWSTLLNRMEYLSSGLENHDTTLQDWSGKNSGILLKSKSSCSNCMLSDTDPKWNMNNADKNFTGIDYYGFNALPSGYLNNDNPDYYRYNHKGYGAFFWTSTSYDNKNALMRNLSSQDSRVFRGFFHKLNAMSVRCIKN